MWYYVITSCLMLLAFAVLYAAKNDPSHDAGKAVTSIIGVVVCDVVFPFVFESFRQGMINLSIVAVCAVIGGCVLFFCQKKPCGQKVFSERV